jgi:hypothetical protein
MNRRSTENDDKNSIIKNITNRLHAYDTLQLPHPAKPEDDDDLDRFLDDLLDAYGIPADK